jgi:hypothetical protein
MFGRKAIDVGVNEDNAMMMRHGEVGTLEYRTEKE